MFELSTQSELKCLFYSSSEIFKSGLMYILSSNFEGVDIVSYSKNNDLIPLVKRNVIDLIIIDFNPNDTDSYQTLKELINVNGAVKILVFAEFMNQVHIENLYKIGVKGFLLMTSKKYEIIKAISSIAKGGRCIDTVVSEILANEFLNNSPLQQSLTQREIQI
ncbi:MAG TPA: hypothetical protein PKD51_15850 [Saprospiraceae bacterium]|nr:hypothetical protein [Saprospiraceae bacterium]